MVKEFCIDACNARQKSCQPRDLHNRTSAAVHDEPFVAEWHRQQLVDTAVAATFSATDSVRACIAVPASVDCSFMQECGATRHHTQDPQNLGGGTAPIPPADRRLKTQISRRCNQVLTTCFVLAEKCSQLRSDPIHCEPVLRRAINQPETLCNFLRVDFCQGFLILVFVCSEMFHHTSSHHIQVKNSHLE